MRRSAIAVLAAALTSTAALAEIPQLMGYQGRITDNSGVPVADGTYAMRFWIYDAETGGTALWDSDILHIPLTGGIFNVMLGESPQPALNLEFDQDYWLLVGFDGWPQTPRRPLGSVGYAYMASGLVAGSEATGSVTSGTLAAIKGTNTATSGQSYGIVGESASLSGRGVHGIATHWNGTTYGGYFESQSGGGGIGVLGTASVASGASYGVVGQSVSADGVGVSGAATATAGGTMGVSGESYSSSGLGVYGRASATTGDAYGVSGRSDSNSGRGVYGSATTNTGTTFGVYGASASTSGRGVYGTATASTGTNYGVYGRSASTSGRGVYGYAAAGTGANYGVRGSTASASGYGVYYSGGLGGTGSKSCVVKTSHGPTFLYCQESPECWFEDFGEGQLVNGRCHVELDPLFLETVTVDAANPMKAFVQPQDLSCKGLAVIPGETGFDVGELLGGTSNSPFSYRVVAKRKGFETKRLDYCKAGETDPYLYPELRERELLEE